MRIGKEKGVPISPELIGLFFEDINFAADGGLYAEMIENRSFEAREAYGNREVLWRWMIRGMPGSPYSSPGKRLRLCSM